MKSKLAKALVVSLALGTVSMPSQAEVSEKTVQVIGRVLGFVQGMSVGNLQVAVIYDPAVPASKAEADKVNQLLSGGYSVGKFTLTPKLVSVSDMSALSGTKLAIVTVGLSAKYSSIFAATSAQGTLSISTDTACVASGNCVLGVNVQPKVEITLNSSAGNNSNIQFAQALRMLVKEV